MKRILLLFICIIWFFKKQIEMCLGFIWALISDFCQNVKCLCLLSLGEIKYQWAFLFVLILFVILACLLVMRFCGWLKKKDVNNKNKVDDTCKSVYESRGVSFLTDEPISNLSEDRLAREGYIKTLLELITRAEKAKSQIIGVYGAWGEGKTSVVKMAQEYNRAKGLPNLEFIWFVPWALVKKDDLDAELFKKISMSLFKRGNQKLRLGFDMLCYACEQTIRVLPNQQGVVQFLLVLFAGIKCFFTSPGKQRRKLEGDLKACDKRLVLVLDDIDRLSKNEVRRVIECIKTNGNLPNITYLVLADSYRLARLIAESVEAEVFVEGNNIETLGAQYLQKIITYPLPLWPIDINKVKEELKILINSLLKRYKMSTGSINEDDYDFCLEKLQDLRQVKRFCVGFELTLVCVKANNPKIGLWNMHMGDLLRLSAVRFFEPKFVSYLYNFYILKCMIHIQGEFPSRAEISQEEFNALLEHANEGSRLWIKRFLSETQIMQENQPKNNYALPYKGNKRMVCDGRLATPECFVRYFLPSEMKESDAIRHKAMQFLQESSDAFSLDYMSPYKWLDIFEFLKLWQFPWDITNPIMLLEKINWIALNCCKLEAEHYRQMKLVYLANQIFVDYLSRKWINSPWEEDFNQELFSVIKMQKMYGVGMLILCGDYLSFHENESPSIYVNPKKMNRNLCLLLFEWFRKDVVLKVFCSPIAERPDAEEIQRRCNYLVLEKFKDYSDMNQVYQKEICEQMKKVEGLRFLRSFSDYNSVGDLEFNRFSVGKEILATIEATCIKYKESIPFEEFKFAKEMLRGTQDAATGEFERCYKERELVEAKKKNEIAKSE